MPKIQENLLGFLCREKDKEKLRKMLKEQRYEILDDSFLIDLLKITNQQLSKEVKVDLVYKLYSNAMITKRIDKYLPPAVKSLCLKIAQKYCMNGKCIAEDKYGCCEGCSRQTINGCKNKPNSCLNFFCLDVLRKLPKKIKKILRLDKCEKDFEVMDLSYEDFLNQEIQNMQRRLE